MPTVQDLLGAATKKGKTTSHLIYDGPNCDNATHELLSIMRQVKELERAEALFRDNIMSVVHTWHDNECSRKRQHEPTVEIRVDNGTLRISFQHRYSKIPLDKQQQLLSAVGGDFDRFFKKAVAVKIKKELTEDPEKLTELVMKLAEAVGPDKFAEVFEVEQTWVPTKVFTETQCQLSGPTKAALSDAGVKQIVAMASK